MATSPTQRALAHCKKQGWTAAVVERWNQYSKTRHDLFGFADLVVLAAPGSHVIEFWDAAGRGPIRTPSPGAILAVQVTSGANVAARVSKIKAEPRALLWLRCGGRVEVWGYRKVKVKRGGKAVRWELRVVEIREADFE